jgi:gliding motility-associated-like protein
MRLLYRAFIILLYFSLQNLKAQSKPIISYRSPVSFTIGKNITPLSPENKGGIVNGTQVSTFAGDGSNGSAEGVGVSASFYVPQGITCDPLGNLYVIDNRNHKIRKVTPQGVVSTFAGIGTLGSADGNASQASFNNPTFICIDLTGNLYIADGGNFKIRKITADGWVSTIAGSGLRGFADGKGINASFSVINGLTVDAFGNIYVADTFNNQRIRRITLDGTVTTIAGDGTIGSVDESALKSTFNGTQGIKIDSEGTLYVADSQNNKIRKISANGIVSTVAGNGTDGAVDGFGTIASFSSPFGLDFDKSGNILVADMNNNKIRKINSLGEVTTIAGSGKQGSEDGAGSTASFYGPADITVNSQGEIFLTTRDNKIKKIVIQKGSYAISPSLPEGLFFSTETGVIYGTPTVLSAEKIYTIIAENDYGKSTFDIKIAVFDNLPVIKYETPNIFFKNQAINLLIPINEGGLPLSYTIVPPIPAGLAFNESTGILSGTPLTTQKTAVYTITAVNTAGRSVFDIEITVKDQFLDSQETFVSEAITPNGDGINDTWVISNIENYPNSIVRVFNRWGTEVFLARNYQNNWDGHYQNNSQSLPESSSYYYQIDLDGDGTKDKDGWIYITR